MDRQEPEHEITERNSDEEWDELRLEVTLGSHESGTVGPSSRTKNLEDLIH